MNHIKRLLSSRLVARTVKRDGKIRLRLAAWGYNPELEDDLEVQVSLTTEEVGKTITELTAIHKHMVKESRFDKEQSSKENERG